LLVVLALAVALVPVLVVVDFTADFAVAFFVVVEAFLAVVGLFVAGDDGGFVVVFAFVEVVLEYSD
jgi:hypothetical protein